MIKDCSLKLIGKLPFTFDSGNCATGGDEIYLCFDYYSYEGNRCRKTQNPLGPFNYVKNSTHDHYYTSVASSGGNYSYTVLLYHFKLYFKLNLSFVDRLHTFFVKYLRIITKIGVQLINTQPER